MTPEEPIPVVSLPNKTYPNRPTYFYFCFKRRLEGAKLSTVREKVKRKKARISFRHDNERKMVYLFGCG